MANYARVYHDATHAYHRSGASVVMTPIHGKAEGLITFDRPDQAREYLGWLIHKGRLRKRKAPFDAATSRGAHQTNQ